MWGEWSETLARVPDAHLRGLSQRRKAVLIGLAAGATTEHLARALAVVERTVRADIHDAMELVCVVLGVHRSGVAAGYWVAHHLACCLESDGSGPAQRARNSR